jgi:hypothetical protein
MVFTWVAPHRFMALVAVCTFTLTACSPAVYKKPAEDFRNTAISLKQAYFIELELSNKAQIERDDLEDQIVIWNSKFDLPFEEIEKLSKKMADRRKKDLHEELKPLREKAFAAIEGYAGVLVSLASGEQTEAVITEVNGLVQDINGVLETVGKLDALAKQSQSIIGFTGPLQQYVGVLTEVIRLVSDVVRERAIVKTIVKSDEPVIGLLTVLKGEAVTARENTRLQMKNVRQDLSPFLKTDNSNKVFRAEITKRMAEITAFEEQINLKENDISNAFDAVIKAQKALLQKAFLNDQTDWGARIREFRERVKSIRDAMEKIKAEM